MKKLFLLRHAKASNDDPTLSDFQRPLTDRGRTDAGLVSDYLKSKNQIPEKIISSSAKRAAETAIIFSTKFQLDNNKIDFLDELYDCYETDYLNVIASLEDHFSSVLIAGHNDTITYVAARLTGTMNPMKTCEVVLIQSEANTWEDFAKGKCVVEWNMNPEMVKK